MKLLLGIAILLMSKICFADTWECYEGERNLYHGKSAKPFFTDNFIACHKLEKRNATIKRKI